MPTSTLPIGEGRCADCGRDIGAGHKRGCMYWIPPMKARIDEEMPPLLEEEFQRQVCQLAQIRNWSLIYHPLDSRGSAPGYPDLTLARRARGNRPARLVFAELKRQGGRLTVAQRDCLETLRQCPQPEVYLWTPKDWDEIESVLE